MNIIEAWKKAKEGQIITRTSVQVTRVKKGTSDCDFVSSMVDYGDGRMSKRMYDVHVLADDWEVVKEKKTWTGTVHEFREGPTSFIPRNGKVTIDWEE